MIPSVFTKAPRPAAAKQPQASLICFQIVQWFVFLRLWLCLMVLLLIYICLWFFKISILYLLADNSSHLSHLCSKLYSFSSIVLDEIIVHIQAHIWLKAKTNVSRDWELCKKGSFNSNSKYCLGACIILPFFFLVSLIWLALLSQVT